MRGRYKTDIERIMASALREAGFDAVHEYPIRCKYGYVLDFALVEQKVDIECDGEPWHGGVRDKHRDGVMKSKGWRVLRFRGQRIRDDVSSCIEEIKTMVR